MEFLKTFFGFNGQQSADFWTELPKEFSKNTESAGETIGQTIGNVIQPTAKAVTAPIFGVALIGLGVAAFVFRNEIKGLFK